MASKSDMKPVEFIPGQPLAPTVIPKVKPTQLRPPDRRMKDVHVQNDWFVRQNLIKDDESYDVPQYIQGVSPDGQIAIVPNPEYDPKQDKNGTLRPLEMSAGPKVGANGQLLPSRYPIKAVAPTGDAKNPHEHVTICTRQDN